MSLYTLGMNDDSCFPTRVSGLGVVPQARKLNYTFELSATKHFISDKVLGSSKTAYLKNKLFPIIGHRITKSDGKYLGCDFEEEGNTTV